MLDSKISRRAGTAPLTLYVGEFFAGYCDDFVNAAVKGLCDGGLRLFAREQAQCANRLDLA